VFWARGALIFGIGDGDFSGFEREGEVVFLGFSLWGFCVFFVLWDC